MAPSLLQGKTVFFYAPAWKTLFTQGKFREGVWYGGDRDQCDLHFILLKAALQKAGYRVIKLNRIAGLRLQPKDYLVCFDYDPTQTMQLQGLPKAQLILYLWESPAFKKNIYEPAMHEYFGTIFTLFDELVDNQRYFKFYEPQPTLTMPAQLPRFEERHFAVILAGNKRSSHPLELYTKRRQQIEFYNTFHPAELDLYGPGWPTSLRVYRGYADSKLEVLQQHKFCICYENAHSIPGYITGEKLFFCLIAGCIPIYWGAPNITEYVPKECFIDGSRLQDPQELYSYLQSISAEQYAVYIANIKAFLSSSKAYKFHAQNFVHIFFQQALHLQVPESGW